MATPIEYVNYVCDQISTIKNVRYKKMFGEYMVYVNDKPILLVCDSTVYVKIKDEIKDLMKNEATGIPYKGAKKHYVLDVENKDLCVKVINELERITPLPRRKSK
ncbi:MAG: TfoX/Sxy family protein [Bacilli bacterium]|mgnify:CR=1 FL=1|nr:TfoX/Sxy family protein [Bacilli bacterium]